MACSQSGSTQQCFMSGSSSGERTHQSIPAVESSQEVSASDKEIGGRTRSDVWKHFQRVIINEEIKSQCNYCKKLLAGKSTNGTSTMKQHLNRCPKRRLVGDIRQMFIKPDLKGVLSSGPYDEKKGREKLGKMIIMHDYPLSMVEHSGFKDFTNTIQPLFKCPSRNTLKNDIMRIYSEERDKVMSLIENIDSSRVAITTDMWTSSNQKRGFMAVTAHFIDKSWTLHSKILRYDKYFLT